MASGLHSLAVMKHFITFFALIAVFVTTTPAFAEDANLDRNQICAGVMQEVGNTAVSGLITAGTGRAVYKLWKRGNRRLLRVILRRGVLVPAALTILGGSGFFSYTSLQASLAVMDLCSASTEELEHYRDQSAIGLLGEESESLRTVILLYGPTTVHNMILALLADNPKAIEENLTQVLQQSNQDDVVEGVGREFELPAESVQP